MVRPGESVHKHQQVIRKKMAIPGNPPASPRGGIF
jgi:hypothetical protein